MKLFPDELRTHDAEDLPRIDAAFLAHRQHMMHGYLNILTATEMPPDRSAPAIRHHFAVAIDT